tara:strand:- start:1201 stop:1680 length:480 start_codon:yes stop_codon:yes gene_type:complete
MKIFCDIDSTINNHWVRIQKNYENNAISDKAWSREEIMKDLPLVGSREALSGLSKSFEINFLTARGDIPDGFNITRDWLDLYDFKYNSLILVKKPIEKVDFMVNNQPSILIDDFSRRQEIGPSYIHLYDDVIKQLKIKKINFFLFKGDWQQTIKEIYEN